MKEAVLKVALGRAMPKLKEAKYCHVNKVINLGDGYAVADVSCVEYSGVEVYWLVLFCWLLDRNGRCAVVRCEFIRKGDSRNAKLSREN